MIKVAAFTAGINIPSARFRVRQLTPALERHGIELHEFFPRMGAYPPTSKIFRPFWAIGSLASRLPGVADSYRYDVVLLQREMISTFATLELLTKSPRILDVDDAIWLHRNGSCARRLARISDSVICGNSFLAENFSQWNPNVSILPTAVDSDRFVPKGPKPASSNLTIGWMGGRDGFVDLRVAERALQIILAKFPDARLRVVSDQYPHCLDLPAHQVEFVRWSPENEVGAVQDMDIGIMPLCDTLWNRGKCAYKMLLYMSCGIPVVVSPIGMTGEVCQMAGVGRAARTTEEWVGAFEEILGDRQRAAAMGSKGRDLIVNSFSIHALAPKLAGQIVRVANRDSANGQRRR
jgi:glycosyltransferase involved in cell wall biosynthesis